MKKFLIILLSFLLLLSSLPISVLSLGEPVGTVSGESGRFYEYITLTNGQNTNVRYTEMNLSGKYGTGKVLRLAECDLSNTNLSIDVINCGAATVNSQTVASAAKSASGNGKTVLCALNGDLWMTGVNSNTNVTKKVLSTTRGIMMIDGEVWATQEFGMENYMNTSGASTVASLKSAFGVTDKNQPIVGAPVFTLKVTNETKNRSFTADGLNRLPAWDSVVVYNHRINTQNYALNDSYEVELTTSSSAFTVGGKVTATVKAIYPSGSTTRPAINKNTILITARGNTVDDLSSVYAVGDTVSFDLTLVDKYGRTEMWQNVEDAIGGHMQVINNDRRIHADTRSSEYPTSLIGVRDDGTVMFANVAANQSGVYKGLRYKDAYDLCQELGYNSVFYLDGGGSASIVTLKNGTYTQRNYSSDGSARAVINAIAMVWNDTPVCEKQGSLAYLTTDSELKNISPTLIPAGAIAKTVYYTNCVDTDYISKTNSFRATASENTNDPFFCLDLSMFSEYVDTSKFKFITLKIKNNTKTEKNTGLYYFTTGQTNIQSTPNSTLPAGTEYSYVTFDMSAQSGWTGELTELRVDIFNSGNSVAGDYVEIEYIAFSPSPREVSYLKGGVYPTGSIKNYYAYKDCSGNHSFTVFTDKGSEYHLSECGRCGYSVLSAHTVVQGSLVPPICTTEGILTEICRDCKRTINTVTLETTDHTFSDNYTVDIEPTYENDGQKSRHCLYCDAVTDIVILPALTVSGDLNGDGYVTSMDINIAKRIVGGNTSPSPAQTLAADIDKDGTVTAFDINTLCRYVAGVVDSL